MSRPYSANAKRITVKARMSFQEYSELLHCSELEHETMSKIIRTAVQEYIEKKYDTKYYPEG